MSKKELMEQERINCQSKLAKEENFSKVSWHYLTQNQKEVAKRVLDGNYRFIQGAGWGFLDKFIIFLKTIKYLDILDVDGKGYSRKMVTIAKILMTYNVKVLMGIGSINQVPQLLFKDVGLLMLLGFTSEQIKNGHCNRGKGKSNKPMHKDTLGDALDRFKPQEMERILNKGVKILAKLGFIRDSIYIMDSTDLETTSKCEGRGMKTVKEKRLNKDKEIIEVLVTKYGFNLLVVRAVKSGQIVAAKVSKINEDPRKYAIKLLKQSIKNVGKDRIKILLIDRGFIDGQLLWSVKRDLKIDFIIPARTNMHITTDARSFRDMKDRDMIFYGKNKKISVLGIKELATYDQYGDEEHNKRNRHDKDFVGNLLNAVVVTKWDGKEYSAGKEKVFLTTLSVRQPLKIIDKYGLRSLVENTTFRELKQGWLINTVPKKTRNGVTSHTILTLCMFNMTNAYRSELGENFTGKGIRRWRRETFSETRNKAVIVSGDYYGIFDLEELMILVGKPPGEFWSVDRKKAEKDYNPDKKFEK